MDIRWHDDVPGKQCVEAGQEMMTPELWGVFPPLAELPAPAHVIWHALSFKCNDFVDIQRDIIVLFSALFFVFFVV